MSDATVLACPDQEAIARADMAEELRRQIVALTEAVRARDDFIAVAAHELRNPLTPIRAHVDLLLKQVRGGRVDPARLEAGLDRLRWLIEHYVRRTTVLLDVSRATADRLRMQPEPVHLRALVEDVVAGLEPFAARTGSAVRLDVPDAIHGEWDRLAMHQMVENLVSNAIKYGGGKPVEVAAAQDGDRLLIRVRDHGAGIRPEDHDRIFAQFERAVAPDKRGGFGLGLWIVRQLAEAMGGAIGVDSAPGAGSTFRLDLPLRATATS